MTKLQQEIFDALLIADADFDFQGNAFEAEAKAASEVAKKYILLAFLYGVENPGASRKAWEHFTKENGIIE